MSSSSSPHVSASGARLLFDPALVPSSIGGRLPSHIVVRPLARDDHANAHIQLLSTLTVAPDLSPETYEARFDAMLASPETYFVLVFAHKETGKILASASLMVELKFLRDAGKVGHIEDVVVDPECKGQSLGKIMIQGLSELGMQRGCYKVILDCDAKNAGFYEKCGYRNVGVEMAIYKQ
ncbi:hypothetical protein FFLO_00060 [Filobasidium floriforme]|uniref:Glucosamine 6-phosphate N-acetyltransferase n=1 Tax=Filobasidium floriforme TaxID=5210 RepID=A0A8K0NTR4_9TREE|nr:acyl-CoA N-acyltransferase [Filobasidium floriforme]KAG7580089.1 hypothetical protein FFLO_00060 [Filobasidium floriforme]KAH8090675.1 acyl-CoA N-acyltransferase [Filobasidium floriforme]